MQPFFPNPYLPPLAPPLPYGNSILLNELHTYFPALLYDSRRFRSISDVSYYVTGEMRRRFDAFSNAQRAYRDSRPPPPPTPIPQTPVNRTYANNRGYTFPVVFESASPLNPTDQSLQTMFNTIFGIPTVPANFSDPVPIVPSVLQILNGSTTYQLAQPSEIPCAICQDIIAAGQTVRNLRGCNHIFHMDCIDTWYMRSPLCPTCRHDVRTVVNTFDSSVGSQTPSTTTTEMTSQPHTNS
jgi:Ring finger domain